MTKEAKLPYKFTIPIGDWSGDGHEKTSDYLYACSHPIEDVREAYFAAKETHPLLDPSTYCNEYEESVPPAEVMEAWAELGFVEREGFLGEWQNGEGLYTDAMAGLAIEFLKLGNPDIEYKSISDDVPMLFNYGQDEKGRHIGSFGYGLFE